MNSLYQLVPASDVPESKSCLRIPASYGCCEEELVAVPVVVNVGMIRRAIEAQHVADDAMMQDEDSEYTWWHVILSAVLEGGN